MATDKLTRYTVAWHTKPGPGSTYYEGHVQVWAEDADGAQDKARHEVWRKMFRDFASASHIVADEVVESEAHRD